MTVDELQKLEPKDEAKPDIAPVTYCNRYLWYGDSGCGKTHLIGTFHKILKSQGSRGVFVFDFDAGIKKLLDDPETKDVGFEPIDLPREFSNVRKRMETLETDLKDYGAIAFDSLTLMQHTVLGWIAENSPTKRLMGFVPSKNDYRILIAMLMLFLDKLKKVSRTHHVVLTAHLQERRSEILQVVELLPNVIGKALPSSLGAWFSEVWYITASASLVGTEYIKKAQTVHGNYHKCKSQTPGMPHSVLAEDALMLSLGMKPELREEPKPASQEPASEPTPKPEKPVPTAEESELDHFESEEKPFA